MIRLQSAHIEELRGIRNLDLEFNGKTVAIWGPNGSGKSGVIDAIEFALTGQIARLTGRGTKSISVADHGPHVDAVKFPDAAFVELTVVIPSLSKTATIKRKVSAPNKPVITPNDADVVAVFDEIAAHPEITLARRDILRFILVEPTKRSEEVQAILKLDDIGQTRTALSSAQNKLRGALKTAGSAMKDARDTLQRHCQIATFGVSELLTAVNVRRERLGLAPLTKLDADTALDEGLAASDKGGEFNKSSALADLVTLQDSVAALPEVAKESVDVVLKAIAQLEGDPALLLALQRVSLLQKGLDLLNGAECPLCDHAWASESDLRDHLREKKAKSDAAATLQSALLAAAGTIATHAETLMGQLRIAYRIAQSRNDTEFATLLASWGTDLRTFKAQLGSLDGVLGTKHRLQQSWAAQPKTFDTLHAAARAAIENLPDQSATVEAQSFLVTAQTRLADFRAASAKHAAADAANAAGVAAYEAYCRAMEGELDALYTDVQAEFSEFYRLINGDDETDFTAKLTPEEGKLDLAVNFYGRGLFPPGAYHSEGHQDGMGVCLYLALMKRLFGSAFTLALLDDVVMSVDSGHRYQFCKLLKERFPETQFVITTHDRLWAEQMRSAGLVTGKSLVAFYSWTVDTGPLVESNTEIWADIDAALAKGKVDNAASALRHHLEFVSRHMADNLRASLVFKGDGNYELGDTLPAVLSRLKELYGKAAAAAQSWGDEGAQQAASARKKQLSESNGASNVEQWAINKAVHYNEWANFGKTDFIPVVAAFKDLLARMNCSTCSAWLYVTPRGGSPEALRCSCASNNLNLKAK
ncbi:MAG: AAA family ATPase [Hyphomonadaceae bacterium]